MIRMTCDVRLADHLPSEELRRLGIQQDIIECIKINILRWFGHVFSRDDSHPIKIAHSFSVTGRRPPGRPKKTWHNAVLELQMVRRLSEVDALNRDIWPSKIQGHPPTSASWDKIEKMQNYLVNYFWYCLRGSFDSKMTRTVNITLVFPWLAFLSRIINTSRWSSSWALVDHVNKTSKFGQSYFASNSSHVKILFNNSESFNGICPVR